MVLNNTHFFTHFMTATLREEQLFEPCRSHYIEEPIDGTLFAAFGVV